MTTYPDTAGGVRRMLQDDSDLARDVIQGATAKPDPQVRGAWLVTLPDGGRLLAYVGEHPLAPAFEQIAAHH